MITNGYLNLGELFTFEDRDGLQVNVHVWTEDEKKAIKDYVKTGTRKPVLVCTNGTATDGTDWIKVSPNLFYPASITYADGSYHVTVNFNLNGAEARMETSFLG